MKISRTIIVICAITGLATFLIGYFKGYHDRSLILTGYYLSVNELYYDKLEKQYTDQLRDSVRVSIYAGAHSYRKMLNNPIKNFIHEISESRTGDMSKHLERADQITRGMNFITNDFNETQ